MNWVLIIFGTKAIMKKQLVQPVFPDYLFVSYDYGLAKWLSVRLGTKWLWIRVQLQSTKRRVSQ